MKIFYILLFLLITCTLFSLILGVLTIGFGGKINLKYSNKLMIARVVMQAFAIISLFLVIGLYGLGKNKNASIKNVEITVEPK